jgi:hypothetical protein
MNTGIQILIERMKTNPEEWCKVETNTKMGKWENIVALFWDYLPEEDQVAYKAARHALLADEFTEEVMKRLAGAVDDGIALTSASHNDINPLTTKIRMQGRIDPYQNNPYQGMGIGQGLRMSTQTDDSNSLYSVPSLQKASAEGNLLSQIAKRMGRK